VLFQQTFRSISTYRQGEDDTVDWQEHSLKIENQYLASMNNFNVDVIWTRVIVNRSWDRIYSWSNLNL
jgi:hypothetical protein